MVVRGLREPTPDYDDSSVQLSLANDGREIDLSEEHLLARRRHSQPEAEEVARAAKKSNAVRRSESNVERGKESMNAWCRLVISN